MELASVVRPSALAQPSDAKKGKFGCDHLAGCTYHTLGAAAATTSETFMMTVDTTREGQRTRPALEWPGQSRLRWRWSRGSCEPRPMPTVWKANLPSLQELVGALLRLGAMQPEEVVGAQRERALLQFEGAIRRLGERDAVTKKGLPIVAPTRPSKNLQALRGRPMRTRQRGWLGISRTWLRLLRSGRGCMARRRGPVLRSECGRSGRGWR